MTLKSQVADRVSHVVNEIEGQAEVLVDRLDDAKEALSDWGAGARRLVRKNPGLAMAGAFALGVALAQLARRRHD